MVRKRKSKFSRNTIWTIVVTLTLFLFITALFSEIYTLISENSKSILTITGALITLFGVLGIINWNKIKRSLWGRIK